MASNINISVEDAKRRLQDLRQSCKTVMQRVELTNTDEYRYLVNIIYPGYFK